MAKQTKTDQNGEPIKRKKRGRKPKSQKTTEDQATNSSDVEPEQPKSAPEQPELTPEQETAVAETAAQTVNEGVTASEPAQGEPVVEAEPEPDPNCMPGSVSDTQENRAQTEEPKPKPVPKLSSQNPDDAIMNIEDAASSMVDGYKESWLPAIRAKAKSMGMGDKATKREWRALFISWGGLGILRN